MSSNFFAKFSLVLISLIIACNDNSALLPSLTTIPVSEIGVTAMTGGTIITPGDSPITEQGVCWSEAPNPGIEDNVLIDTSGEGEFALEIKWLEAATTYHVRSYARTRDGLAFGQQESFTTPEYFESTNVEPDNTDSDCQQFIENASPDGTACCVSGVTSGNPGDVLTFKLFSNIEGPVITWFVVAGKMAVVSGEGTNTVSLQLGEDFTEGYLHVNADNGLGSACSIPIPIRLIE